MAAYFTGGGAGTDVVQAAGTDGLQTLYLMNPSYPPAATTFCRQRHGAQQQAPAAAGTSAAAVSPVLSLSSREAAPPVTVAAAAAAAAVPGGTDQEKVVMRSRYLKAAQELLDEAVSVSKGAATAVKKKEDSEGGVSGGGGGAEDGGGSKSGAAAEMSTAERQELQMKKSKLLNMLDEVEQRYRQYHRQMQGVAAAFEAAAGAGSATTYTSLALRTISRQFRCLRDAIAAQVRAASRGLGEDCGDDEGGGGGGRTTVGSRLRFIDHQLRQQRAMQQLGMVHAAAAGGAAGGGWRPQRGLPERAVSVLRAWLFEHFLHPYPKDSDKVMLAKQTGLTRSQVSNWFINARVRLWKPMVEEMYAEETKAKEEEEEEHDAAAAAAGDRGGVAEQAPNKPDDSAGIGMSSSSPAVAASRSVGVHAGNQHAQASFYGGGGGGNNPFQCRDQEGEDDNGGRAAAARRSRLGEAAVSHRELLMKFTEAGGEGVRTGHPHVNDDDDDVPGGAGGYSLFTAAQYGHQFGSDHFAFAGHGGGGGGGVSLTLGLPHGADQTPASFLIGAGAGSDGGGAPVTTAGYDMNMQSTKSLAAQLMRDFVA
ncbi:hypothetical protein OsJ_35304 [Oryza sativa Japonica Group]|uniref:Homeobox domain-containing protein n=1 Tax=Oryza sativa subsp. japonica TaxID=39947 RepID=B9GC00_ORYSJ|nr:hypothetical protein OsJ_35304 [Oryza sativa Japonica Group]